MGFAELLLLALGLSMDAFAVAICKGLGMKKARLRHALVTGLWFGGFQALMPLMGYLLGTAFEQYIIAVDHWVVFALLVLIGGNMIREALGSGKDCAEGDDKGFGWKPMLLMALATSIDALAVGITFALLPGVNIISAISCIGLVTFLLCTVGVRAGRLLGSGCSGKAGLAGGVILILIGSKILLEHLGILG